MAVLSPAEQRAQQEGRLAASVTLPSGRVKRWGPDEASTADILAGLNFSTSDPGGFKDSNFGLARDTDIDWPDLALLLNLELYGAGGRTAWEGRLQERPGRHGDDRTVSPGAVGWSAHLNDRPFQEIYIDRDVSKWTEPSIQRKINTLGGGFRYEGQLTQGGQDAGATGPGLLLSFERFDTTATELGEAWYYGNGVDLGDIRWDFITPKNAGESPAWEDRMALSSNDLLSSFDLSPSHNNVAAANLDLAASAAGRKYAAFWVQYNTAAFEGPSPSVRGATNIRVFGRHGLPTHGTPPKEGLYASDVIADIVSRFAPKLRFTTGAEGTIAPTSYVIPQLAFTTPIKPADAILAVNAYHQYSWGVEDDRTFFYRPTSQFRKRWRIRRSKGDQDELLGPQADAAVNGVVVSFTDPAGVQRIVGPPELTTAYATSEGLVDTRATNPVNAAGIGAKWGELQLGFVTDVSGAIQVGAMWLAAQLEHASSRGSVRVTGVVEDENGAFYPAWAMRAGDSATVVDGDGVERRIIESTYAADARQCSCQLDSTPHKFEALMERMGIALQGIV